MMKAIKSINEAKTVLRDSTQHKCRVETGLWRQMLLENEDTVVINATVKMIIGRKFGPGVYELQAMKMETG